MAGAGRGRQLSKGGDGEEVVVGAGQLGRGDERQAAHVALARQVQHPRPAQLGLENLNQRVKEGSEKDQRRIRESGCDCQVMGKLTRDRP